VYACNGPKKHHVYARNGTKKHHVYACNGPKNHHVYASNGTKKHHMYACNGPKKHHVYTCNGLNNHHVYARNRPKKHHVYACNETKYPACVINGPEKPVNARNGPTADAVSNTLLPHGPVSKIFPTETGSSNTDSVYSEWLGTKELARQELASKEL
ncbi:unnamed protein product, partial [Meganyctiphanes norvegica]